VHVSFCCHSLVKLSIPFSVVVCTRGYDKKLYIGCFEFCFSGDVVGVPLFRVFFLIKKIASLNGACGATLRAFRRIGAAPSLRRLTFSADSYEVLDRLTSSRVSIVGVCVCCSGEESWPNT
jgi:hypothetical protein